MDKQALFDVTYGLFVLMAREGEKDNGCIINTVMQVTELPFQMTIAVNKENYTHDMIHRTKEFNLSILDQTTPFKTFEQFGYQSGKEIDKLAGVSIKRSDNQIAYLTDHSCAYISCKVTQEIDLGTHTLFIATITEATKLSSVEAVSYTYYQTNIKPKPESTEKKGWRCVICGYIYEGDELPPDYVCPICKHGVSDFEKLQNRAFCNFQSLFYSMVPLHIRF